MIELLWDVQEKLPNRVSCMGGHLQRGEYIEYVHHLAELAGVFIAMGEEMAGTLLTDDEAERMSGDGIKGQIIDDFKEAKGENGDIN